MTDSGRPPRVGLLYRETAAAMSLMDVAHAADERGFHSIAIGEHTHIPVSRQSPFPGGGDLPDAYAEFPDPYVALAFVAAHTRLSIAVTIALVAQHDPIALAKTAATLDRMSGGRLTLGVGFGWNREELASHGKSFKDRRAIVRDYVQLMRAIWTQTEAEYHGEHASLEASWSWPKPAQPSVPVLLGVQAGERAFEAIIEWGDGWIPGGNDPDWLAGRLGELRARWADAGREPDGPVVWAMQNVILGDDELRAQLSRFRDLGIDQVLLDIPTTGSDEILPLLDRYAKVIESTYR